MSVGAGTAANPANPGDADPGPDKGAPVAMAPVRLEARGLGLTLDGARILEGVTCSVEVRRLAVIGPNGSGKSTFLRLIDALVQPTEGNLTVAGLDPAAEPRRVHEAVGFVFTNPDAQIIMPTVAEDVAFSLRNSRHGGRRLTTAEVDARVGAALARFGLDELADVPARSLSGGQKQLLALAAALAREPKLVLADEPTTMLDLPNSLWVARELTERLPVPLIVATHNLELAARCDLALRFEAGRLVEVDEPAVAIAHYRESVQPTTQ